MGEKSKKYMESKEGVDALFLHATEGILVADDRGVIIRTNPSLERLFNYDKGELIGKKIEVLIPKKNENDHIKHRDKFAHNPHARSMGIGLELYGLRKDNTEFPVEISLSPYLTENGSYVIAFVVDITLRKEVEEKLKNYSIDLELQVKNRTLILEEAISELEKTKKNLNKALEKERELNELKSRFVSMASHEFRTPLTTMMSSLSLVTKYGEQADLENQSKHITKIKTSIHNLTDILNDFLSLSKLEEGKVEIKLEEFNLEAYIQEIISELKPMAKANQTFVYSHLGKIEVNLDKKLLKNILFNLISNALKFSPAGGIIEIKTLVSAVEIVIIVKDSGIGIPQEDQEHLFERFFRGKNATHIQGTGLGLNIVNKYASLMNGEINFESTENKGTTFELHIPV